MARDSKTPPGIARTEAQRQVALERFAVLQPHLEEEDVSHVLGPLRWLVQIHTD